MKNNTGSTSKAVITMPIDFQEALFKPLEDDNFLLSVFDNNQAITDDFFAILNDKAFELSNDFIADKWVVGHEPDTE